MIQLEALVSENWMLELSRASDSKDSHETSTKSIERFFVHHGLAGGAGSVQSAPLWHRCSPFRL